MVNYIHVYGYGDQSNHSECSVDGEGSCPFPLIVDTYGIFEGLFSFHKDMPLLWLNHNFAYNLI